MACPQNRTTWCGSMKLGTNQFALGQGQQNKKRFCAICSNRAGPLTVDILSKKTTITSYYCNTGRVLAMLVLAVQLGAATKRGSSKNINCNTDQPKLHILVYDILPPTTAIVDYATGLEKLSANEQLFSDAQTAVTL